MIEKKTPISNVDYGYEENNIDYIEKAVGIVKLLWTKKKLLLITFFVLFVLTSGITLLMPNYYTAEAIVLPSGGSSGMSSLLSSLGAGGILGGNNGIESMPTLTTLYPIIGKDNYILKQVLDEPYKTSTIGQYLSSNKDKNTLLSDLLEALSRKIEINVNAKLGYVKVSTTDKDPEFAAAITNALLVRIDVFFRDKITTSSRNQLELIDRRLTQVADSLNAVENSLLEFREKNRVISASPKLIMEEQRLLRDVQVSTVLYTELIKQKELALIDNMRDKPVINKLSYASVPEKKSGPTRSIIVIQVVFLGMIITLLYIWMVKKNLTVKIKEAFYSEESRIE